MQNTNQENVVIAQIQNLMKELQKCAPHPDRPEQTGPQFLHKDANHQLPAEYDSMLGSMMMESMLGDAFAEAVCDMGMSWMSNADKVSECASTVYQDRIQPSIKIGSRRVIANDFNRSGGANEGAEYLAQMAAYLADLPARMHLEKWLSHETRRLYALRKNTPHPAPSFGYAA